MFFGNTLWETKRTSSFSSLCFSSVSFRIMLACVSLVSSSFSFRSLCLKTFSRFWKEVYERKLFDFLLRRVTKNPNTVTDNSCVWQLTQRPWRVSRVRIHTASRWSYCEMSPFSFSARAPFSWQSAVLRLLCSSIWAWISLSVPWKWVVISFLFRSSSLHLCRVSSCIPEINVWARSSSVAVVFCLSNHCGSSHWNLSHLQLSRLKNVQLLELEQLMSLLLFSQCLSQVPDVVDDVSFLLEFKT